MIGRRWLVALALLLGLFLSGPRGTLAVFTDEGAVGAGALSSGRILTPAAPTVQTTGLGSRRLSWQAVNVETGVGPVEVPRYELLRFPSANGGEPTVVCSVTAPIRTCDLTGQPLFSYYAVRARLGDQWIEEGPRATILGDIVRPTITHTSPTNGQAGAANAVRNAVRDECGETGVACGTVSDDVGVVAMTYTLQRNSGFLGLSTACWNGSAWATAPLGGCAARGLETTTSGGVTTWVVPGSRTVAYPNNPTATFTLTITASDSVGAANSQIRFTID